ncbi:hypothetical protein B0H14DRAFT_3140023, partial [Mycena olivaceomarginata]
MVAKCKKLKSSEIWSTVCSTGTFLSHSEAFDSPFLHECPNTCFLGRFASAGGIQHHRRLALLYRFHHGYRTPQLG